MWPFGTAKKCSVVSYMEGQCSQPACVTLRRQWVQCIQAAFWPDLSAAAAQSCCFSMGCRQMDSTILAIGRA